VEEASSPSIAVLPFVDMSPHKDQEYFCDGIAEEIINGLTRLEGLRVVARTSAFAFKDKHEDIREIGSKLNVNTLLDGSVRKAGLRLRITVQLVNAADGYQLWSERYDRDMEDVFAIQDEISLAIVDTLKVRLLEGEKTRLLNRFTADLEAYNLCLKGRYFWNKRTEGGLKKAIEYFEQSITKDPNYAAAYTGLADCYLVLGSYNYLSPKETFPNAKAAAEKALKIDDRLAEAHTSLAGLRQYWDWDWEDAEREFKRATELNSGYATAHHWYAVFLVAMGRFDESVAEAERARTLDPLSLPLNSLMGWVLYEARQYDRSIEEYRKALEMDPSYVVVYSRLALAYTQIAEYEKAIANIQKGMDLSEGGTTEMMTALGYVYSMLGKKREAMRVLKELHETSRRRYVSPVEIAVVYAGLSQKDEAFKWLETAYQQRDHSLGNLKVEPQLDNLRSDRRFAELLKRMGLSN